MKSSTSLSSISRAIPVLIVVFLYCVELCVAPRSALAQVSTTVTDINPDQSTLHDGDPNGASGGRVNRLGYSSNGNSLYAASEWGGLFKGMHNAFYLTTFDGMDFVIVVVEMGLSLPTAAWANGVFASYPDRRGILVAHNIAPGSFYENFIVEQNDNIFLSVSGHRVPPREQYWTTTSPSGYIQHNIETDY